MADWKRFTVAWAAEVRPLKESDGLAKWMEFVEKCKSEDALTEAVERLGEVAALRKNGGSREPWPSLAELRSAYFDFVARNRAPQLPSQSEANCPYCHGTGSAWGVYSYDLKAMVDVHHGPLPIATAVAQELYCHCVVGVRKNDECCRLRGLPLVKIPYDWIDRMFRDDGAATAREQANAFAALCEREYLRLHPPEPREERRQRQRSASAGASGSFVCGEPL